MHDSLGMFTEQGSLTTTMARMTSISKQKPQNSMAHDVKCNEVSAGPQAREPLWHCKYRPCERSRCSLRHVRKEVGYCEKLWWHRGT